jgi:hypothetical protein
MVRYTDADPEDSHGARRPNHPLWEVAHSEMNGDLIELRCGTKAMKEVHREQHKTTLFQNTVWCSIPLAALRGFTFDAFPEKIKEIANAMQDRNQSNSRKIEKQLRAAKERYTSVTRPEPMYLIATLTVKKRPTRPECCRASLGSGLAKQLKMPNSPKC